MTHNITKPAYRRVGIAITRDADWHDSGLVLKDPDRVAISLSGATLQLYIRPTYDFASPIKVLTSGGDGINILDAASGFWEINVSRETVIAELPVGVWEQFLVLTKSGYRTEIWRGPLTVYPSKI